MNRHILHSPPPPPGQNGPPLRVPSASRRPPPAKKPGYLKLIVAGVAVWSAAIVAISALDHVQPVIPALDFTVPAGLLVAVISYYEGQRRPELKSAYFDKGLAFGLIVALGAAVLIGGQHLIEGGRQKGAITAFMDLYRPPDATTKAVAEKVEKVSQQVSSVATTTTTIDTTTRGIDTTTKGIAKTLDQMNQQADPVETAKQEIIRAGLTIDNAGYMKSRSNVALMGQMANYATLGIDGDEATLKSALVRYPASSNEYTHLANFMAAAGSDHYSRKVRKELLTVFKDAEKQRSVSAIRNYACGPKSSDFIAQFLRRSLSEHCDDELNWLATVTKVAQKVIMPLNEPDSYAWWMMTASNAIKYEPNPAAVSKAASSARVLTYQQLLSNYRGQAPRVDEYLKIDATVTVARSADAGAFSVHLFEPGKNLPLILLQYEGPDASKSPCAMTITANSWNIDAYYAALKPRCTARVTIQSGAQTGLKVVAIENPTLRR